MILKKTLCAVLIFYVWMFLWPYSAATAWEIDFQPRFEGGITYYAFESEAVNAVLLPLPVNLNAGANYSRGAFEFSDYLPFASCGGTLFFDRFYLDFGGLQSGKGKDSTTTGFSCYWMLDADEENHNFNTVFSANEEQYEAHFDRREMAVSLGYAINRRANVYAGYKWAGTRLKTTYNTAVSDRTYGYEDLYVYSYGRMWGAVDFRFEYEGPFLGGLYGWEINTDGIFNGVLTTSLALARLNGKVKLDYRQGYYTTLELDGQAAPEVIIPFDDGGVFPRGPTKGTALGATIGLSWHGETAIKGLCYFLGVNGYRYEFDSESAVESNINETAVSYKVGLSYLF